MSNLYLYVITFRYAEVHLCGAHFTFLICLFIAHFNKNTSNVFIFATYITKKKHNEIIIPHEHAVTPAFHKS